MDRYRLRIPFRVSEESLDYVSTDEPMSHPRRREENGDGGSDAVEWADAGEDNIEAIESFRGRCSDSMEVDEVDVGDRGVRVRQDREEKEEEEGEIDEEGAVVGPIATGERKCDEEEVGDRGPGSPGGEMSEEEEEGEVGPSEASVLAGANDGLLQTESAGLDGGEDGAIIVPPRSSVVGNSEGSSGRERSAPVTRTFIPPSEDLLCPIPSGPAEGAVMLGLDCEMVSE